jgi:lipopolysaccharide/colanic/teichoic acid biosynthesis glycosyltransferase
MTRETVSVIVPAYNAESTIANCVAAIRNQVYDKPFEIIVIDDGSTDATAERAKAGDVIVISTKRRRPAAARNTGIEAASGNLVCCTDADCIPHPDWLSEITKPFKDPSVIACKGIYSTRQREVVARFVQLEYEDKYDLLRIQPDIDFIDTYSAAYRRDILQANGGFDERFFYLEDQELSFRLAARAYRMVFQERAVVEHRHSRTLAAYIRKKVTIGYWKAQVVRRFPGQAVRDSHTPQVMKIQMLLIAMLLIALVAGGLGAIIADSILLNGTGWYFLVPAGLIAISFMITTIPFVQKAWRKDRLVAILSPFFLVARAAGLGIGYGWGVVHPERGVDSEHIISGLSYVIKRVFDIFLALPGLIFTLLTWPIWALIIKLDSKGPILFRQERIGERGRPFTLYKFRSMHVGAAARWPELVTTLGLSEPVLKLADDPRLTRAGRFMRRWSLDELPQFWNVLKGEMSLVGPRPEETRVVAYYTDWHRRRLAVKPGMTGLMQISGRADLTLDERVQFDLDYIENYSLGRDMIILLKTVPIVLKGKGAR